MISNGDEFLSLTYCALSTCTIYACSTYTSESTGRGLTFEGNGEILYYTGNVGKKPHDEDLYRDIAKQIMKQVNDNEWPVEVAVTIIQGSTEQVVPWIKRNDREDFLHGGHF